MLSEKASVVFRNQGGCMCVRGGSPVCALEEKTKKTHCSSTGKHQNSEGKISILAAQPHLHHTENLDKMMDQKYCMPIFKWLIKCQQNSKYSAFRRTVQNPNFRAHKYRSVEPQLCSSLCLNHVCKDKDRTE